MNQNGQTNLRDVFTRKFVFDNIIDINIILNYD